ncbi:hypothetical protein [Aeromicrobium sp. CF3.5]|uniref:hypothetical protein n=1 Tax=Aeromicrobium sp. CF3.5 TaxID=3373078 RepID=UPI003EE6DAAA
MTALSRRFTSLALAVSVGAASVGLAAPTQAAPTQAVPGDDVTITTTADDVTYSDADLADESTDTVRGTLRVAFVERRTTTGSTDVQLVFAIVTARGDTVPIELAEDLPTDAANGAIEAEVVDDSSAAPQVAEAVVEIPPDDQEPASAGREHRAFVATVAKTGSFSTGATIRSTYDDSVLREWVTESGGAITDFRVAEVRSLPPASTTQSVASLCAMDDPDITWQAAERLFPDVSFGGDSGNHLIVLNSPACNAQAWVGIGVGTVGTSIDSGGWLSVLADPAVEKATGVHELGHNFGLLHANAKACAQRCGSQEYHDVYSVMGFAVEGTDPPALDAIFRDALGITGDDEVTVLTESEPVERRLAARGSASGTRAIKVIDPLVDEPFWIEYRDGTVRDTGSAYAGSSPFAIDSFRFQPGVTITQPGPDGSLDLVAHPRGTVSNGALAPGDVWTSPSGAVVVTAGAVDATGRATSARIDIDSARLGFSTEGVSAVARVGAVATVDPSTEPAGETYTWRVDDQPVATGDSYVPVAADRGRALTLVVQRPSGGQSTSTPVVVGSGRFVAAPTPKLSGTARVAARLTATPGTWSPSATFSYQWYANGAAISGARSSTYTIASAHKGKRIQVKVTGNRSGYTAASRTSASSSTVAGNTFSAPTPSIRGTRKVGSTLTAIHGTWSPTPTTYRYQWYVGSTAISGQKGKTYRPGASRAGKKIRVKIVGVRSGYVSLAKYSPYTAALKR